MKHICFAFLLLSGLQASAQSLQLKVLASAGNEAVGGSHTLRYTLGETAILSSNANGFRLEEGFWHNGISIPTQVVEFDGYEFDVVVAPNPTQGAFRIMVEAGTPKRFRFVLRDLSGRIVEESFADMGTTQLEMGGAYLANGHYFLSLQTPEGHSLKTFSVQKVR
jgi:hypothetical protein